MDLHAQCRCAFSASQDTTHASRTPHILPLYQLALFDMPNSNRFDIDIFQNLLIDIDIFQNLIIDIAIFQNLLINIDIFPISLSIFLSILIFSKKLTDILSISIFSQKVSIFHQYYEKCRYIDNQYRYFIKKT